MRLKSAQNNVLLQKEPEWGEEEKAEWKRHRDTAGANLDKCMFEKSGIPTRKQTAHDHAEGELTTIDIDVVNAHVRAERSTLSLREYLLFLLTLLCWGIGYIYCALWEMYKGTDSWPRFLPPRSASHLFSSMLFCSVVEQIVPVDLTKTFRK